MTVLWRSTSLESCITSHPPLHSGISPPTLTIEAIEENDSRFLARLLQPLRFSLWWTCGLRRGNVSPCKPDGDACLLKRKGEGSSQSVFEKLGTLTIHRRGTGLPNSSNSYTSWILPRFSTSSISSSTRDLYKRRFYLYVSSRPETERSANEHMPEGDAAADCKYTRQPERERFTLISTQFMGFHDRNSSLPIP